MKKLLTAALSGVVALSVPAVHGQKPERDPEGEKQKHEEDRIRKAVERAVNPKETERVHLIRELAKFPPADPRLEDGKNEADLFFDRLTGGANEWHVNMVRGKGGHDHFQRITARLNLVDGRITREQFRTYAATYLRAAGSPPWRSAADEGNEAFHDLDRNQDGVLDENETSAWLRNSLKQWDSNRDARVDRGEFAAYFGARVEAAAQEHAERKSRKEGRPEPPPAAPVSPSPQGQRGRVDRVEAIRFGHLPPGLPAWFAGLDSDRDGQVGLYEWRRDGRPLADFATLDQNDDGFLIADEWLRFARRNPDDAAHFLPTEPPGKTGFTAVAVKGR